MHMTQVGGAVAAATCALLVLVGCASHGSAPTAAGERRGLPSCGDEELTAPPDASIDWTHYIRWNDRMYAAQYEPSTGFEPDQRLGVVTCTRAGSLTPVKHTPRHAEAAFLTTGTGVYSVVGQPRDGALTAEWDGRGWLFRFDARATRGLSSPE